MSVDGDIIDIQNLFFSWKKGDEAVLNIQRLTISRGERVFIKGASGSGKSTLLSLIGGVLLPQSGSVSVLGQQLDQLRGTQRDAFRAEHIGFIFQMFNLIAYLSVIDNVLLPCHFSKQRKRNIESKGLVLRDEAIRLLSHLNIPEEMLDRPVTELSVGQQQRVAAARALIGSPEIIIADEPTSAMDADTRDNFLKLLLEECLQQNTTLIFVSHDSALESRFDRGVNLADINTTKQGG